MKKKRNRSWALILTLALIITCMPVLAFAEDDPIDFYEVTENLSGSYMFELGSQECFISVDSENDLVSAVSSDESIVRIRHLQDNGSSWELAVDPVGLGKATITVEDTAGNKGSCSVEVKEGIFFYSKDEVRVFVTREDAYLYVHAYDLDASDFESSDPEVASVRTAWSLGAGRCGCGLDLHKCGETTITAHDNEGRTASVNLIVTESDWEINTNSLEFELSEGYKAWDALKIELGNDYYADFYVTSSDEDVVTAFMNGYEVALELHSVGEADVTVNDYCGKSRVCHVIVDPDPPTPFGFTETSYKFVYEPNSTDEESFYLIEDCETAIVSVSVDTEGVVEVDLGNEGSEGKFYRLDVRPIGLGEAVITATDEQGLTATITISVVDEIFLDQSYFGSTNATDPGSYDSQAVYGDTVLYCHCNYDGTVASCKVGTKTYEATIENETCTLEIPRITTKTISVTFTNGEFSYTSKATVEKKKAEFVKATAASVTYNGKAQSPKVTVKDGSYTLKKGTDYTVTYKNNKNVATAKPKDAQTIRYSKNSVTSRTFSGLVSGRTYYVRVRTYKKVGGNYIYSFWSTVKKIKVK